MNSNDINSSRRRARRTRLYSRQLQVLRCLTLFGASLVQPDTPVLNAQQKKASEFQVKATYLFNFGRFVQWPSNAVSTQGDSFSICVIGEDPFGSALDGILQGETIDGKTVVPRRIAKPQEGVNCRILYISVSEEARLSVLLAAIENAGVLTVSDIPDFSQRGGMIQFVTAGSRVRFEVNLASTQSAGLTLSSELLKVAAAVKKPSQPGD